LFEMLNTRLDAVLVVLGGALGCSGLRATDFFVAPNGTQLGPGTLSQPYDLATALSGHVSQPGDTFWLRGGEYRLGHLDTSIEGAAGRPVTFRGVTGEYPRVDGSVSVFNSSGYVTFRDFEMFSSDTNRISAQTGVGFSVTDIITLSGFSSYAPNVSFINLVVHDQTRHGIYLYQGSTNALIYGCILFNNGWVSPDNAEGHGLYVQGNVGTRMLADNVIFNNCGVSLHIYDNAVGETLQGVILDGNVAFHAGAIQNVREYRDWVIGVDLPADFADGIVLANNMGYQAADANFYPEVQIGRDAINGSVIITNNYMPLGLRMSNWRQATVSGNLFAPRSTDHVINLDQTLVELDGNWDNNLYVFDPVGSEIMLNSLPYDFSTWQQATGFDLSSTLVSGELHGIRVFVRSNLYEPGRANIVVYNWDKSSTVSVDVSSVLPWGWGFEVRNAQDLQAAPVLSGVFRGQRLELPMTNLTVASLSLPVTAPFVLASPTGPDFNVFVLLPARPTPLISRTDGSIRIYWPVSLGTDALQFSSRLGGSDDWQSLTTDPVVVGDQFMASEFPEAASKFYRLRVR